MRPVAIVLCLILLSTPAFPNEQSDVEAVEKHLRLEKEAFRIYERAKKRAENAVKKSSLGRELSRLREVSRHETKISTKSKPSLNRDIIRKLTANMFKSFPIKDKYAKFVRIMTYKFLDDEIRELRETKRNAILRILVESELSGLEHELSSLEAELSSLEAELSSLEAEMEFLKDR
ncbi:MAG: hypothetical protein OXE44_13810 [Nitrospinae bacterium]|nr:hypothetical protein [Nitrospinota bacterium]